ncbi:MAG TPA: hydroxyisourate hydrolase [Rubrivivax sp.]
MNVLSSLGCGLAAAVVLCAPLPAASQAAAGGRLTVHVLDLYSGSPANGMRIDLISVDAGATTMLKSVTTNADGRPPEGPLLVADTMKTGRYQAVAYIGDYYKRIGAKLPAGFHNRLILEFDILDTKLPHHVPFQVTPWTQSASVLPG